MIASPRILPSMRSPLESAARQTGWAVALRGVVAILFGVVAIRSPNGAASAFVIAFAIYAFADGLLDFVLAGQLGRARQRWGWYLFAGLASVALGAVALTYPCVTLMAIVFLVALRAIVSGIVELAGAFSWSGLQHRWLLGLAGILSIAVGALLLVRPVVGALALLWTIGVYAVVYGVVLFALGVRMLSAERHEARLHPRGPAATAG